LQFLVEPRAVLRDGLPQACSVSTGAPVVIHPSPKRAASPIDRPALPATMNGMRGDWSDPGALRASIAEKKSPSHVVLWLQSTRSSNSTNST